MNCAETLRQSGFTGQVTMISKEESLPYDRTLLSKALLVGDASKFGLRPSGFLKSADIDFMGKRSVYRVDSDKKTVILTNGDHIAYDKLCIATGCDPWKPPVKGLDLKNVFPLRSNKD